MEHTPIPQTSYESLGAGGHRSAWGTWFEVAKPWSVMNSTFEVSIHPFHTCIWVDPEVSALAIKHEHLSGERQFC